MDIQLGEFEGQQVQAAIARWSGRTTQRVGKYERGEFAYVVAKVRLDKVSYDDFTVGSGSTSTRLFTRLQDFKVVNSFLINEEQGQHMLTEAAAMADDTFGVQTLFNQTEPDLEPKEDMWDEALAKINDEEPQDDPEA